jgi:uncharacterized cupin superfamily protein
MALTHTVGVVYRSDAGTITNTTDSYTADGEENYDGTIAPGISQIALTLDVSAIQSEVLYSTCALTLATNHAPQTVSTLTSSTTTATATTSGAHGYTTGDLVVIAGATPAAYNGTFAITVTDTDEFTYTFAGSGTSPATGTIKAIKGDDVIALAAGKQLVWTVDRLEANPLTADVTGLYAINATAATTGTVKFRFLVDVTP